MNHGPIALFSLDSDADFAASVDRSLDLEPGAHEERDFGDGEHKIRPLKSVRDRDVLVYDDLIASGTTMTRAAEAFLGAAARSVHAAATHGLFSGNPIASWIPTTWRVSRLPTPSRLSG